VAGVLAVRVFGMLEDGTLEAGASISSLNRTSLTMHL